MRRCTRQYPRRLSSLSTAKVSSMAPQYVEQALETRTVQCVNTGHLLKRMKGLKKLKRKMGLSSRWNLSSTLPHAPLFFHSVCGDNVRVTQDGRVVRRTQSFCKGVAFSNRPVRVNERVCVRLLEIASNWSGILRIGFTSVNPETLRGNLPKYVCPDLTSRPGFWAKAVSERYGKQGSVLFFCFTSVGDVIYGMDDTEVGVFLTGVDVREPLWVVVDVYGNSTSLQLLDPYTSLNNRSEEQRASAQVRTSNGALSNRSTPAQPAQPYPSSSSPDDTVTIPGFGDLNISDPSVIHAIQYESSRNALPLIVHQNVSFTPMSFHSTKGANISFLDYNRTVVKRNINEYSKGYVFTSRPLNVNEKIVLQVLSNEPHYVGAMAFGVTSANPANLTSADLPEDCDDLLDRPEYWVVCKDVAASPKAGDELSFTYSANGQVTFAKNNGSPHVIMHVDDSLKLHAFFDVFGHTAKLRLLGSVRVTDSSRSMEQQHRDLQRRLHATIGDPREAPSTTRAAAPVPQQPAAPTNPSLQQPGGYRPSPATSYCQDVSPPPTLGHLSPLTSVTRIHASDTCSTCPAADSCSATQPSNSGFHHHLPSTAVTSGAAPAQRHSCITPHTPTISHVGGEPSECSVCYERPVDSVLYSCGHMCMCYTCAQQQWRGRGGGVCPICRAVIKDVIRTYRA